MIFTRIGTGIKTANHNFHMNIKYRQCNYNCGTYYNSINMKYLEQASL